MRGLFDKEQILDSIEWQGKKKKFNKGDSDVTITVGKDGRYKFTFRNEIWKCITNTDYVVFAPCKGRMFFKESDSRNGYKLCISGPTPNRYMFTTIMGDTDFIGDYELKYDDFLELYYIERG